MFRYELVNSTRKFTIVAEIVSLLKKIYKRDAHSRAVFKVKTLAVLFLPYPREMKHIPQNLNLPPFWRLLVSIEMVQSIATRALSRARGLSMRTHLTAVSSRAPCLGADQKARGLELWERGWFVSRLAQENPTARRVTIWRRMIGKACLMKMKFKKVVCLSVQQNCSNAAHRSVSVGFHFPLVVRSQMWCRLHLAVHFGFSDLRFHGHLVKYEKYILPLHTQSGFQVHLDYTYKL